MLNAEAKIICDRGHYTICKQNFPALLTFELMTKFHFNYHGLTPIQLLSTICLDRGLLRDCETSNFAKVHFQL